MYEKEYFNDKVIPYHSAEEECDCKDFCGKNCYNRQSRIECNDSICSLGKQCGNRRLQQMDYIKAEVFPEFEMGWGLRATEFAPKNSLIVEYVGEVIDDVEMKKRMWNQRQNTPSDKDYYIMLIGNIMKFMPIYEIIYFNI
jgi:SET domain-containing protein